MKKTTLLSIALILLSSAFSQAGNLSMNLRSRLYSNLVDGATAYSLLREGTYNTHDISMNYSARRNNTTFNSGISARATNDAAAYRDEFNLHRWFAGVNSHSGALAYGLTVGDIYGNFSDFVFSRSLTGGTGYLSFGKFKLQPLYGMQYGSIENSRYRRNSMGLRVAQDIGSGWNAGFSYAKTGDDEDSMYDDTGLIPIEKNTVYGFDISGRIYNSLSVRLDRAWSSREEEITDIEEEGAAYRLSADYRARKLNIGGEYSVAGSSFSSLTGYSDRDRRVRSINAAYRFGDTANTRVSYETYSNNIDGNLEYTTAVYSPRLRTDFRVMNNILLNLDLRSRKIESDDLSTTVDRKFTSRGGGIRYSIGPSNLRLNYTISKSIDENDSNRDYDENALSLSGGGSYSLNNGSVRLAPSASYRYSKRKQGAGSSNKSSGYNLALNSIFSDLGSAGVSRSLSKRFGGSTNSRTSITASYFIAGSPSRTLEAEYAVRNTDTGDQDSSYTDKIFRMGTSLRF